MHGNDNATGPLSMMDDSGLGGAGEVFVEETVPAGVTGDGEE